LSRGGLGVSIKTVLNKMLFSAERRQAMKNIIMTLGLDKDFILGAVFFILGLYIFREIFFMRIFPYLDDWTLFRMYNLKDRRGQKRR
jgi:hypothetical protein